MVPIGPGLCSGTHQRAAAKEHKEKKTVMPITLQHIPCQVSHFTYMEAGLTTDKEISATDKANDGASPLT